MATFRDILGYYQRYKHIAVFSMAASSAFELIDLVVPYAIGQILNILSGQPLDQPLQNDTLNNTVDSYEHQRLAPQLGA